MHQTMDVIRFWTWMLAFRRIWMNMMIKIRRKKTLILIARFWARKSRLQKTAKNQEIQKDKCCKYQHFGVRD